MRAMIAVCLILAGCQSDPAVMVKKADPTPLYVSADCWKACEQSPEWKTADDGSADWDKLGADQPVIEAQKAQCEANRKACADALQRLIDYGVIVIDVIVFGGKK